MRAREMMAKLDGLPTPKSEVKLWDLSLLAPEEQDRVWELLKLIRESKDVYSESLDAVFAKLVDLVDDLPLLGPDDPEQGPLIEVPDGLADYWQWQQKASKWRSYDFCKLSKVQTLRFVELCEQYGFKNGTNFKAQMLPLHAWPDCDRSELQEMLDIAASRQGD